MLQQKKEEGFSFVAAYWADWINNLKTIYDIQSNKKQVDRMEETMNKARKSKGNLARGSNPVPSLIDVSDSIDGVTEVYISQEPGFNFVFNENEEVQQ